MLETTPHLVNDNVRVVFFVAILYFVAVCACVCMYQRSETTMMINKVIVLLVACLAVGTWAQGAFPPCQDECTHTQGFWKNHHSGKGKCKPAPDCTWPICLSTGETAELNTLCLLPWLTIFQTPPKGSAWFILAHQYIAAQLNLKDGRCTNASVAVIVQVLGQALDKLDLCILDEKPSTALGMQMVALASFLDAVNNGQFGPLVCFDDGQEPPPPPTNDTECPPQDCGERVCEIVEICRFEKPPVCDGNGDGDCCECDDRTFEEGCCTRTRGYWSTHNSEKCPGPPSTNCTAEGFAWADNSESKVICNGTAGAVTWLDVFDLDNNAGCNGGGNAWPQLAAQWVAAQLNVIHNGACVTLDVATALNQASVLLEANCDPRCIEPASPDGLLADALKTILDEYNNGVRGPGHCEECECPDCPPL